MLNNEVLQSEIKSGDEIDLDQMAEETEQLRSIRGTTELQVSQGLREWLMPVGRVVNPSFGGRIEASPGRLLDDGQVRFKCGR